MVNVSGIAEPDIQTQGVELGDRPDGVEINLWPNDHVIFLLGLEKDRTAWSVGDRSSILGIIDIVVVFDPDAGPDAKADGPDKEVVWDAVNVLATRFTGCFAGQRRPN